jgi:hypothetical protein
MGTNTTLQDFVSKALEKGESRENIATALATAGWDAQEIKKAMAAYHPVDFAVPVPSKSYSLAARDTVFYLFLFATLYLASWGVILLAFSILNLALPDITSTGSTDYAENRIRYWVAWCVVFVPVYLLFAWKAEKRAKQDPNCPMSSARQWLTYITLFFAGMTALGDIIALLYHFLSGEMTLRFALKVLVVGMVSGGVILYYLGDIRKTEDTGTDHAF